MGKTIVRINKTNDDGSRKKEVEANENKVRKHKKSFNEFLNDLNDDKFEDFFPTKDIDIEDDIYEKYIKKN